MIQHGRRHLVLIDLKAKRLFLFDLDGVLLRGKERPIKIGGTEIIEKIRKKEKKLFVLTNNSTDTVETLRGRLRKLGIPITQDEILTSTRLTAEYVKAKYGNATYFLIGEAGFDEELRRKGLKRTRGNSADVVLVGLDRRLTYGKLDRAVKNVVNGADIVATHASAMYMSRYGPAVSVGPTLRAIEYATGKKGVAIGKPQPLMFVTALERSKCSKKEAVMIGDQEDTDILGATNFGVDSILVLSGMAHGNLRTLAKETLQNIDELASLI